MVSSLKLLADALGCSVSQLRSDYYDAYLMCRRGYSLSDILRFIYGEHTE